MGKIFEVLADPPGALRDKLKGGTGMAAQPPETIAAPAVMPIADEEAAKERKRRAALAASSARGRQSTILTGSGADTLGG